MRIGTKGDRGTFADELGQSLVEFALAMPLLLVILLGVADLGRAFYYTSAIANAARAGAAYAALNGPSTTAASVAAKACNETGFTSYSASPTCPGLDATTAFGAGQVTVTVTYDFNFFSAYLLDRVFAVNPLVLRASATFPSLSQ